MGRSPGRAGYRGAFSVLTALAVAAGMLLVAAASPATAAAGCRVDYAVNQWPGGFTADVAVHNLGDPVDGWTLTWAFTAGQVIQQGWNGVFAQTGQQVTVTNVNWNARIATSSTVRLGFQASWQGSNPTPAAFSLNGTACTGAVVTPTSAPPTTTPTTTPTTDPPADPPVDNPFLGAVGYLNPDHVARVNAAADAAEAPLSGAMREVARHPTAVWLDSIASITAGRGLRGHLDAALAQQTAAGRPVVITLVLQNLPNRSCGNLVLHGELTVAEDGLRRYREEYLDPIAAILADPRYAALRVAVIVEPESLHYLLVPNPVPACAEVIQANAYTLGVRHALNRLSVVPNVYSYLDAANSSLIGFEANLGPAAALYASIVRGTAAGTASIAGFAVNTANYVPVQETLLPDPNQLVGGQPLRSARFYEWNSVFDEADLVDLLYPALVSLGFPPSIGFVIDTSRNGWSGPPPSPPGIPSTPDQAVDWMRIDRRFARINWCNQTNAGLGARPQAAPRPHVDAYLWVKVPGESDGVSDPTLPEARQMEPMCDPWHRGPGGQPSGAMPNAPVRGDWFPAAFTELVRRAYPPLSGQ